MKFDPKPHMMNLKGKDYLPVPPRIEWLSAENPAYTIETEFLALEKDFCIARAIVTILDPQDPTKPIRKATATKSQHKAKFPDFIEKAETSAIGRALAFLGLGTLSAQELDESDETGTVHTADSAPHAKPQPQQSPRPTQKPQQPQSDPPSPRLQDIPVKPASSLPSPAPKPADNPDLPEYPHSTTNLHECMPKAKLLRLLEIGRVLFNLEGDPLYKRLLETATNILKKQVFDLEQLHWRDGQEITRQVKDQAVKRGLWERRA